MTCSPLPPTLYTVVSTESFGEEEDEEEEVEEEESDLEGTAPTPKRRKLAREKALTNSLGSGLYPVFMGIEGPSNDANPGDSNALDYLPSDGTFNAAQCHYGKLFNFYFILILYILSYAYSIFALHVACIYIYIQYIQYFLWNRALWPAPPSNLAVVNFVPSSSK